MSWSIGKIFCSLFSILISNVYHFVCICVFLLFFPLSLGGYTILNDKYFFILDGITNVLCSYCSYTSRHVFVASVCGLMSMGRAILFAICFNSVRGMGNVFRVGDIALDVSSGETASETLCGVVVVLDFEFVDGTPTDGVVFGVDGCRCDSSCEAVVKSVLLVWESVLIKPLLFREVKSIASKADKLDRGLCSGNDGDCTEDAVAVVANVVRGLVPDAVLLGVFVRDTYGFLAIAVGRGVPDGMDVVDGVVELCFGAPGEVEPFRSWLLSFCTDNGMILF